MVVIRALMALLILVAVPVSAQKPRTARKPAPEKAEAAKPANAGVPSEFTVGTITVVGARSFTAEQVLAMVNLKQGQTARREHFEAAQQKLLESGLFETVAYRYDPAGRDRPGVYNATLELKEIDQLFPYRFEALAVDERALRSWLKEKEPQFTDRLPATEPVLQRFSALIEEFFKQAKADIQVRGRLMPDDKGRLEIVFQPSQLPSVAEVRFVGNSTISQTTLQQAVAGTAVGSIYTEERFRQVLERTVRPAYEALGRLRVSFPKIDTQPAPGVKGLIVTVHVAEGEQYKLNSVRLTGPVADDKSLYKAGSFALNAIVNMKAVDDGTERIERALKKRGYLSARSVVERKVNDAAKSVDLTIEVDPGPQYKMGTLTIEGLDIQTEPHIRKLWALKPNQAFDFEYPDAFIAQMPEVLDNLGRTRAAVNPDSGTLKVDVILIFAAPEKKPKSAIP